MNRNPFAVVDFFCGAGGSARGALDAGMTLLAGVDNNGLYRKTFVENNRNSDGSYPDFIEKDLRTKSKERPEGEAFDVIEALKRTTGPARENGQPLMFIFCPPCQPFTSVNRGKLSIDMELARKSDKNLLYFALPYVDTFKPEAILCENVSGIRDAKYGGIWDTFERTLSEIGYITGSAVIDTVNYGIAQHRKRSILLAIRRDVLTADATLTEDGRNLLIPDGDGNARMLTVRDVLGHLRPIRAGETDGIDPDHRASAVNEQNRLRLEAATPGGTNAEYANSDLEVGCHKRLRDKMDKDGRRTGGYTDAYTRLHPDKPAPTITTKCFSFSNGRFGHFDRQQNRALSIREAALLQSFPEKYVFQTSSIQKSAMMIGNAVPPKLCEFFTSYLRSLVAC
jgi:DNA (cytosine-5)-methyltransferase 1